MISCYNHFIIQDISGWDIRKVENLEYMFWYAYAFKQNLCSWRVKDFPFNKCSGIFGGSGCQNKGNPVDTSSPFCETQCGGILDSSIDEIYVGGSSVCDALDHMSVDVEV